jgi:hypothetical protein
MRQSSLPILAATSILGLASGCTEEVPEIPYASVTEVGQSSDGRLIVAGYSTPCQCQSPSGFIEFLDANDNLEDFASQLQAAEIPEERTLPPVWSVAECAEGEFVGATGSWLPYSVARGPSWETEEIDGEWILVSIAGNACDDMIAVGRYPADSDYADEGVVATYDGSKWSLADTPQGLPALASVWVGTVGTFAVGDEGTVLSFDGEAWNLVDVPTEVNLCTIWGTDDSLFVAGGASEGDYAILQYFEDEWTVVDEGKGILLGMDGRAIDDIFAVGGKEDTSSNELSCMALHFDGSQWDSVDCGSAYYLWDVVTLSNGRTVGGGPDATLVELVD